MVTKTSRKSNLQRKHWWYWYSTQHRNIELYSCITFESQLFSKRMLYSKQINVITGAPLERRARGNCPRCPPLTPALSVESDLSIRCLLSPLISLDEHVWRLYRTPWKASGVVPKEKWAYALQRKSYIFLESRWFEFFVTENFKNAATYLISRCRNEEQSVVSSKLAEMRHPVSSQLHHCM